MSDKSQTFEKNSKKKQPEQPKEADSLDIGLPENIARRNPRDGMDDLVWDEGNVWGAVYYHGGGRFGYGER